MLEVILTAVRMSPEQDNGDGTTTPAFPYTTVYRLEFDYQEGFERWLEVTKYHGDGAPTGPQFGNLGKLLHNAQATMIGCTSLEVMAGVVPND
jgi:hypothetical protein